MVKWFTSILTLTQSKLESDGQGLSFVLYKDKIKCKYFYWIGYKNIPLSTKTMHLHDMLRLMEFVLDQSMFRVARSILQAKVNSYVPVCSRHADIGTFVL